MSKESKKLIIVGDSSFAEIAYEYFTADYGYEVEAFSVEKKYIKNNQLFGIPIVPFEELDKIFTPENYFFFVAIVYSQLNKLRTRLFIECKKKGFTPISYISPKSFIWKNSKIGEHCFIFEGNVIQPFVQIGNNVILWSGNHIGHHSKIGDNTFISSHVVISGHCDIGQYNFIGVNATIADTVKIGNNCIIGAGALILSDVEEDDKTIVGIWKTKKGKSIR